MDFNTCKRIGQIIDLILLESKPLCVLKYTQNDMFDYLIFNCCSLELCTCKRFSMKYFSLLKLLICYYWLVLARYPGRFWLLFRGVTGGSPQTSYLKFIRCPIFYAVMTTKQHNLIDQVSYLLTF